MGEEEEIISQVGHCQEGLVLLFSRADHVCSRSSPLAIIPGYIMLGHMTQTSKQELLLPCAYMGTRSGTEPGVDGM